MEDENCEEGLREMMINFKEMVAYHAFQKRMLKRMPSIQGTSISLGDSNTHKDKAVLGNQQEQKWISGHQEPQMDRPSVKQSISNKNYMVSRQDRHLISIGFHVHCYEFG